MFDVEWLLFTNLRIFVHAGLIELSFDRKFYYKNNICIWINTFDPTWRKKKTKKQKKWSSKDFNYLLIYSKCCKARWKLKLLGQTIFYSFKIPDQIYSTLLQICTALNNETSNKLILRVIKLRLILWKFMTLETHLNERDKREISRL